MQTTNIDTNSKPSDPLTQAKKADKISGVAPPGILETKRIAQEGFVFGLPLVMYYTSTYELFVDTTSSQYKAPIGQLTNEARVFTYKDTAVITPNSDTPYGLMEVDLRAEPSVISVPEIPGPRYYAVQLTDANTYNYGYIGSRATGTAAGDYMIVGPDWKGDTPSGIKEVFHSTTPFTVVIFRTQLFNAEDMPNVVKIQAGFQVQPLSAFLKQPAPSPSPAINYMKADAEIAKAQFWEILDFALQYSPASPNEVDIRAKLASIGIGPGKPFDMKDLSLLHKAEILLGMKAGNDQVDEYIKSGGAVIHGWNIGSFFGDRAYINGDWLKRAAAAKGGIFGNSAMEAMYPLTRVDSSGKTMDGSKHNYTITFEKGNLPPVNAFWSVTMYDGKTQFLIENPIDRYLINSPMLPGMTTNPDGSLTLYIQKDAPPKEKAANWLPAPDGPIYLVMRLYWPKEKAPSILPAGKGSWQPPAVAAAA